jgi:predicted dehydrogenase
MHLEGARVAAVLAQDAATAREDAGALKEYGITAEAYGDMEMLIDQHRPDAFVIASPATTHAAYVSRAVAAGMHVLCEKPFIWDSGCDIQQVSQILDSAREQGLTVAMNSQWPFVLPVYEKLCGLPPLEQLKSFYIQLAPLSRGRDMIPDSMPHALSILYSVLGPGSLEQVKLQPESDSLQVVFTYVGEHGHCRVTADLVHETRQPRSFAFGFNGSIARRTIDMETYRIAFTSGDQRLEADDPLQLSVRDFLHACRQGTSAQIEGAHIVNTMKMLEQIYTAWPLERPYEKEN